MKKLYSLLLASLLIITITDITAQTPPCNLTGGSVYIDHASAPWMMNATVNGMSMYNYSWTDTNGLVIGTANQMPFYTQWCVTITDNITGCDTTICQDCTAGTSVCMCTMIYMPVCGCDGVMYSNYCLADCADVSWTPAIPNGTLGGFLPCTQPSACEVEISGDSIICNWGSPQVLTAVPTAGTPPYTYLWGSGQSNSHILTITTPGTYCVTVTDANGCTATECIDVAVQEIPIYSIPNPPEICAGDSIVLEIDTSSFLYNITWIPNTIITPPFHRIVDFPILSQTYIVEGLDSVGCDRRGEILVTVDSCGLCIDSSLINPNIICLAVVDPVCGCDGNTYNNDCEALNWYGVTSWTQGPCSGITNFACMGGVAPGITTCVGPGNYVLGQANVIGVYPTMAACIADSCTITPPPPPCTVEINNGTIDVEICDGDTTMLEATAGFDTYVWTLASTGATLGTTHIIEVTASGLYIVIVTDSTNCVDMDSIEVIVYPATPLNPMTSPTPPAVCVGDSVVIEVNQGFVNYTWNTGNPLDQGENRVVVYPTQNFTYVVEALDANGCESREEILVLVDTCESWDCNLSTGICFDPGTGNGQYPTLADCIADSCDNTLNLSWDCDNGICFDPGTGLGAFASLSDCQINCETNDISEEITGLLIYPNPVKNTLTIDGYYISATIYDVFGKVVLTTDYQKTIDVAAFGSGIYFMHINTNNASTVKKITIAK